MGYELFVGHDTYLYTTIYRHFIGTNSLGALKYGKNNRGLTPSLHT